MRRRDFVAYGSAAALGAAFIKQQIDQEAAAQTAVSFELHMEEILEEMIDGEVFHAMTYRDPVSRAMRPPLRVRKGATVNIKLVNTTDKPRRFAITGYPENTFPSIPAGATANVQFVARASGSYIYHEVSEGAVGRLVGLHGAFIVMPAPNEGKTPAGSSTPFDSAKLTPAATMVFDTMGTYRFPGDKWRNDLPGRDLVWLMGEIDPKINQAAERGVYIDLNDQTYFFRPRYFTLNGLSGYDAAHDKATVPKGYVGEPCLIRTMNAGACTHAPHIHGNHVFQLSDVDSNDNCIVNSNVHELDTWILPPMSRKDMLLPFEVPNEIPSDAWPPKQEPWPLLYPMHCHIEMSQTARGGQYPQGMITHWELLGPKRGGAV